jgi:hypothetical protein
MDESTQASDMCLGSYIAYCNLHTFSKLDVSKYSICSARDPGWLHLRSRTDRGSRVKVPATRRRLGRLCTAYRHFSPGIIRRHVKLHAAPFAA